MYQTQSKYYNFNFCCHYKTGFYSVCHLSKWKWTLLINEFKAIVWVSLMFFEFSKYLICGHILDTVKFWILQGQIFLRHSLLSCLCVFWVYYCSGNIFHIDHIWISPRKVLSFFLILLPLLAGKEELWEVDSCSYSEPLSLLGWLVFSKSWANCANKSASFLWLSLSRLWMSRAMMSRFSFANFNDDFLF